jgi:hypothetical protein
MESLNPKGPEETEEQIEEERFLNQEEPGNQAAKPNTKHKH